MVKTDGEEAPKKSTWAVLKELQRQFSGNDPEENDDNTEGHSGERRSSKRDSHHSHSTLANSHMVAQAHFQQNDGPKTTFVDAAAMKEKVREKLSKPQYRVTDYYHDQGFCQKVARSDIFDKMTLSVIAFNALWIAIDTDFNDATLLLDAKPTFIIVENFFCTYFAFEWVMRFGAFKRKFNGLKDAWFVFDSFMVSMMVLETWIFTGLVLITGLGAGGGGGNVGVLRLARLLRLSRMARMGKLLRVMPELMIMLKGMKAAMRSVFWTLLLLIVITYMFSIAFVQLSTESDIGPRFFPTVWESMHTLAIYGIFLDNVGLFTTELGKQAEYVLVTIFFVFILLGALTVMNMLVGVLCEVVSAVAATEQEEMLVQYVNEKISRVMEVVDTDGTGTISKDEFKQILDNGEAVRCLHDVGVDVFALIDLSDYIFQTDESSGSDEIDLDFGRFMEVVLQLRGTNQATVKDIVDLRKFMRLLMQEQTKTTAVILDKLSEGTKLSQLLALKMNVDITELSPTESMKWSESMGRFVKQASPDESSIRQTSEDGTFNNEDSSASNLMLSATPNISAECDLDDPDTVMQAKARMDSLSEDFLGEYSFDRGLPPQPPHLTPNGQLLSLIPISNDINLEISKDINPDVILNGLCLPTYGYDVEDRQKTKMRPAESDARKREPIWNNSLSSNSAATSGHNGQNAKQTDLNNVIRIPRLYAECEDGASDDIELNTLQLHFEAIYRKLAEDLANGLGNAANLAGQSFKRRHVIEMAQGKSSKL